MAGTKFAPLFIAGWPVLPLKRDGDKRPLVSGYHGKERLHADRETVKGWAEEFPECNPGIVMPDDVIGLDVDNHDGTDGLVALRKFEAEHGPLPEGPRIFHGYTDDGEPSPYGTRLFRVPKSLLDKFEPGRIAGNLNKIAGPGVDTVLPWLRYNVAPGAVHKSGETYEWALGDTPLDIVPKPTDLPYLSSAHVKALVRGANRERAAQDRAKAPRPGAPILGGVAGAKPLVGVGEEMLGLTDPKARGRQLLRLTGELARLPEGETLLIEGEQRGWQKGDGFFVLAAALKRLCWDLDYSDARVEKVRQEFVKAAVADGDGLDDQEAERQWENAAERVEEDDEPPYPCPPMGLPFEFTEEYVRRHHTTDQGVLTLRFNDGDYWTWDGTHYRPITPKGVKAMVGRNLRGATARTADGPERVIWRKGLKGEVLDALEELVLVDEHGATLLLPATGGVPFRNGWLNVKTGELEPLGPERDIRWVVAARYDPNATCPEWFKFLDSIGWTEGTDHRRLLRQWIGWLISGDTSIHKGALLVGPKRAGKGTVLAVCEALMGDGSVGIQLGDFARNFGLAPIIGKGLATIGDARFGFRTDKSMVERLLSLMSFDTMNIDVKNKDGFQGRPTARLMVASNETPKFIEASDALASRFLVFEFVETFYGREDLGLMGRLRKELPGIARWALGGYAEVVADGRFAETEAGLRMQEQIMRDAAPIREFVDEECVLGTDKWVETQKLYDRYALWCDRNGMFKMDRSLMMRDLGTAYPGQIHNLRKMVGGKRVQCKTGVTIR